LSLYIAILYFKLLTLIGFLLLILRGHLSGRMAGHPKTKY